jgi:hypothetical protein
MDAKDYLINQVLGDGRRFMVPLYQRQYQWGADRVVPFWEDVVAKADEAMAGSAKFQHYMGALILAPGGDGYSVGVTPRVQVVDGQQRLTTFQLFLAALREAALQRAAESIARRTDDYLFNPKRSADTDPLAKYKLAPTPNDRELFHDIVSDPISNVRAKHNQYYFQNGRIRKNGVPPALAAYELLYSRINHYADYGLPDPETKLTGESADGTENPDLGRERLDALLQGMLGNMKLVVITLDEGDDAQVIFETLNSKGQPLLAMDLVRNNIFHRAEAQGEQVELLYQKLWSPFDDAWWREDAPRARPRLPRIDHFLAHSLTAQTGQATSMRELYAEYRSFAKPKTKSRFDRVEDELIALTRFAAAYETLEGKKTDDKPLVWFGRKLATWEVTTAYPVAFQVADAGISDTEAREVFRLIYSFVVRRAVCGLTPKNLNGVFQRIAARFLRDQVSLATLSAVFNELSGPAVRFPDDAELTSAFMRNPLYAWLSAPRLADILWELELASRSAFMEPLPRPENMWIEHVMPQNWTANWPLPAKVAETNSGTEADSDTAVARRNSAVDTLGNLTLVTSGLNISMGNEDFEAKKAKLSGNSLLALNGWFKDRETWDEAEIDRRAGHLSALAVKIWAAPQA